MLMRQNRAPALSISNAVVNRLDTETSLIYKEYETLLMINPVPVFLIPVKISLLKKEYSLGYTMSEFIDTYLLYSGSGSIIHVHP